MGNGEEGWEEGRKGKREGGYQRLGLLRTRMGRENTYLGAGPDSHFSGLHYIWE